MNDLPWMKVYLGSEMAKTISLTAEEFGAYERLRRYYWEHDGLPDDDRRLMRITGVDPDHWDDVRSGICHLFREGWRMPDLDAEREVAAGQRVKAVERSQRANAAKYGRPLPPRSSPPSTPPGNPTRSTHNVPEGDLGGVLVGSPSASASDEVRYEERLAPTHAHAHERTPAREALDPDVIPKPENETKGRAWLLRQGLVDRQADTLLPMLMQGRLCQSQVDQIASR